MQVGQFRGAPLGQTLVLNTVVVHGGRVIKNLGDEVLFVTDDPASAAEATLQLLEIHHR